MSVRKLVASTDEKKKAGQILKEIFLTGLMTTVWGFGCMITLKTGYLAWRRC